MKSKLRLLFPALLLALPLSGCSFISIADADEDETEVVDKYYKDYNLNRTGGRLIQELQKMCFDKHTNWVKYGQLASYYVKTRDHNSSDAVSDGSSGFQLFYTASTVTAYTSSQNREHVWPCANSAGLWTHDAPEAGKFSPHYVDKSYYVGGGSDLYHVRPCDGDINTARGNSQFCDFDDPEYAGYDEGEGIVSLTDKGGLYPIKIYGADKTAAGKYEFASRAEVADQMKGDLARIILYMYVHYQERGDTPSGYVTSSNYQYKYTDMTGALSLKAIMGYDDEERCREKLIEWNQMDPPSEVEKLRNQTVQKIQGNRNPFVDHPELVAQMFE